MLHLQARVHFQEIEIRVAIHQKLHRPGVGVARRARDLQRRLPHSLAQIRMRRHERGRALLDHLLMPPLDGTLALAQVDQVAVMIAQDLDFDVPRLFHQLFDIDFAVAEGAPGFARGIAQSRLQLGFADPRGASPCRLRPPTL